MGASSGATLVEGQMAMQCRGYARSNETSIENV